MPGIVGWLIMLRAGSMPNLLPATYLSHHAVAGQPATAAGQQTEPSAHEAAAGCLAGRQGCSGRQQQRQK